MTVTIIPERSDSTANRKPRFNTLDVANFVLFPLVLLVGFLLFMYLKRTAADPNLRLIAQVTAEISVELIAVASQSRQRDGSIKWWKPNGLPALDIREDLFGSKAGTGQKGICFLYTYNDERPGEMQWCADPHQLSLANGRARE